MMKKLIFIIVIFLIIIFQISLIWNNSNFFQNKIIADEDLAIKRAKKIGMPLVMVNSILYLSNGEQFFMDEYYYKIWRVKEVFLEKKFRKIENLDGTYYLMDFGKCKLKRNDFILKYYLYLYENKKRSISLIFTFYLQYVSGKTVINKVDINNIEDKKSGTFDTPISVVSATQYFYKTAFVHEEENNDSDEQNQTNDSTNNDSQDNNEENEN